MESKQSEVIHLQRVQALETWLKTTNIKLTQCNGQRKYGGPPEVWEGPTPGSHCEVFINHIPRDAYEDQLIPLFSSVGPLWEFRLMMNFSGQNRGFAFAKYGSSAVASEAIRLLHGHMLQPGFFLKVRRSVEKRHLCIAHLPAAIRREELLQVLRALAEGVESASLSDGSDGEEVSATVTFTSHYAASMAKKMLVEAFKKQFALTVSVQWQSTVKPKPLRAHKLSFPSPLEPPLHSLSSSQPSVPHPPPAGFCRAVGGPISPRHPHRSSTFSPSSTQGCPVSAKSPVMFLRDACEATGFGQPVYDMNYSHTGPDGSIYLTYTVCIPGITMKFKGLVMVLPGPSANTMLEKARQAAAQQVLQKLASSPTELLGHQWASSS